MKNKPFFFQDLDHKSAQNQNPISHNISINVHEFNQKKRHYLFIKKKKKSVHAPQTLHKTLVDVAYEEGSRKSSTRQPGSVSIKYSDMLLVSLMWLSRGVELELKIEFECDDDEIFFWSSMDVVVVVFVVSQQVEDEGLGL